MEIVKRGSEYGIWAIHRDAPQRLISVPRDKRIDSLLDHLFRVVVRHGDCHEPAKSTSADTPNPVMVWRL